MLSLRAETTRKASEKFARGLKKKGRNDPPVYVKVPSKASGQDGEGWYPVLAGYCCSGLNANQNRKFKGRAGALYSK